MSHYCYLYSWQSRANQSDNSDLGSHFLFMPNVINCLNAFVGSTIALIKTMNAFFWLILYLCVNIVWIALCCHYSTSKRWMKIAGSACLIPFIYVVMSSIVPNHEFANPMVFITIPIMWIGFGLFFYRNKKVLWILCIIFTVLEVFLQILCDDKRREREEQWYNEYRLEKYRNSPEYRKQYDKYNDNLKDNQDL